MIFMFDSMLGEAVGVAVTPSTVHDVAQHFPIPPKED